MHETKCQINKLIRFINMSYYDAMVKDLVYPCEGEGFKRKS
jgi:hypothetical protein